MTATKTKVPFAARTLPRGWAYVLAAAGFGLGLWAGFGLGVWGGYEYGFRKGQERLAEELIGVVTGP